MTAAIAPNPAPQVPGKGWAYALIFFGVVSIGTGFAAAVYPGVTLLVISILFGINIIIMSMVDLVEAITDSEAETLSRVLVGLLSILGLIAGIIVLRHPANSLAVIILAIGLYLIVAGVIHTVRALTTLTQDRARRALFGILTFTAGVIILAVPGISLVTLAAFAAAGMIVRGIGAIALGLKLRKAL
jgi:uncharacterized membrane protein HdeD (DUF308 family)